MKKDEEAVEGVMKVLQEWSSNPQDTEITAIQCLESGELALKQLEQGYNAAKKLGEQQINQFF